MTWPRQGLTHFARSEFARPDEMPERLLLFLDEVRERAGVPIRITSDVRTREETDALYPGNPGFNSPHLRGAIDLQPLVPSAHNRLLVLAAITGLYAEGKAEGLGLEVADRHFHIDFDTELRRPWFWLGKSK